MNEEAAIAPAERIPATRLGGAVETPPAVMFGGTDPGRISLSLPVLVGSIIVPATFDTTMPGDGDTNRIFGPLSGGLTGVAILTRQ